MLFLSFFDFARFCKGGRVPFSKQGVPYVCAPTVRNETLVAREAVVKIHGDTRHHSTKKTRPWNPAGRLIMRFAFKYVIS